MNNNNGNKPIAWLSRPFFTLFIPSPPLVHFYINNNKETIKNFEKAIQKGLNYVKNHSDKEVAQTILKQFPDTSLNDLESAVKRYREIEAWPETTKFNKDSFDHLQDIMIDNGVLQEKVSYDKLMYQTSNK